MKQLILLVLLVATSLPAFAVGTTAQNDWAQNVEGIAGLTANMPNMSLDGFLALTPKTYRATTGERLGLKGALQLKAAQRIVKKHANGGAEDIPKGLYIVGAIFGLGWLAMGIMDDFEGNNWWISLILYIACWLPGLIYSLVKMKEYY